MGTTAKRYLVAALGLAALASTIGACSGSSGDSAATKEFATAGADISAASADGGALAQAPDGPAAGTQAAEGRDVVYTGRLTVGVDDAPGAADDARATAEEAGGYLANSAAELDGERRVSVTLRVPSDEFEPVMAALADLGEVQARDVGSDDVTDQVVDLEGRLENARTSADRLRGLLAKAENIQNVISIEDRLTQRETEIESLTGQLEVVQDQVAMATIDATFTEADAPAVSDDLPGFLEAMRTGAIAVANVALVVVALVGFTIPFLPFVALAWFLVRRWRRSHPKAPKPTSHLPPPPG